jgi:opacity protein-like surface antigen
MKKYLGAAVVTVAMIGAAYATAPSTAPATPPSAGAGAGTSTGASATFTLQAADATTLRTWIMAQNTASMPAPAGFTATVGATLPTQVTLHPIPASAGVAAVGMNQYAVVDNKIVLVNPSDRKIVYVFS